MKCTINPTASAKYLFRLVSDDGAKLWIDRNLLIDNDGLHGTIERPCTLALDAGLHSFRVDFFQKGGDFALAAKWEGPGIAKQEIPGSALCRKK